MSLPGVEPLRRIRDGRVRRRLLRDDSSQEDIVDEVHHHWVVYVPPALEVLVALGIFYAAALSSPQGAWVLILLGLGLIAYATWRAVIQLLDVFVITNLRVFRVTGVFSSRHASTPLSRILDITVDQPTLGLLLRYGHFTFESAAQEQGLRDIRYVGRPLQRDQTIQSLQMALLKRSRHEKKP